MSEFIWPSSKFQTCRIILLKVDNKIILPNLPILDNEATNKEYVDSEIVNGYTRTIINNSTYSPTSDDDIIAVKYTTIGPVTINLPKISGKKQYTIVDEGGNANQYNITVNADSSDTIIGQSFFTISNNYNAIKIYNDELNSWFIR